VDLVEMFSLVKLSSARVGRIALKLFAGTSSFSTS
jgi:hypothetical protein